MIQRLPEFIGMVLYADDVVDGRNAFKNSAIVLEGKKVNLSVRELLLNRRSKSSCKKAVAEILTKVFNS